MKKPFNQTKVGKWLLGNAPKVLDIVGDVFPPAKLLTSLIKGDSEISPEKKLEFERMDMEEYEREREYHLKNTKDARGNYQFAKDIVDRIALRVMNWNVPMVFLLLGGLVLTTEFSNGGLQTIIAATIGGIITKLLDERSIILNFFFGSSLGSKLKSNDLQESK